MSHRASTRLALGATPTEVFWLMMRRGQGLAFVGIVLGLASAYAGGRAVASVLYGVHASDPTVLLSATAIVILITWIASPSQHAAPRTPIQCSSCEETNSRC